MGYLLKLFPFINVKMNIVKANDDFKREMGFYRCFFYEKHC